MSNPAPGRVAGTAFGGAIMTALAQLGLASGLAVLIWREGTPAEWAAHLSWTTWLTAVSTVVGGFLASRIASTTTARVIAIPAAGLGGFVVAPLIAVPAMSFADSTLSAAPFIAAGIGSVVGMIFAAVSLASKAVAINVAASIALTWLLATLSAFVPIGDTGEEIRPGIWGSWRDVVGALGEGSLSVAPPLLIGSLLIGAATALVASDTTCDPRVTAISGAIGPLLLVVGYVAAGQPGVGVEVQWAGIYTACYAVIAGLLGSLLVSALRRPTSTVQQTTEASSRSYEPVPEPVTSPDQYDESRTATLPASTPPDPYVSAEYETYDDWNEPTSAPDRDDRIMPPAPRVPDHDTDPPKDETENWVNDLKDEDALFSETDKPKKATPKKPKKPRKKKEKPEESA